MAAGSLFALSRLIMLRRVTQSSLRGLARVNYLNKTKIQTLGSSWSQEQCALISTSVFVASPSRPKRLIPGREEFASRHIGPRESDRNQMLAYLGFKVSLLMDN